MSDATPIRRPTLLTASAVVTALLSGLWTAFFLLSGVAGSRHELDGHPVSRGEFFLRVGLPLALLGVAGLRLAWGLWRHRRWARPLAVALCFLAPVIPTLLDAPARRGLPQALLVAVGWAALTAACLFGLPSVRRYYAALATRGATPAAG